MAKARCDTRFRVKKSHVFDYSISVGILLVFCRGNVLGTGSENRDLTVLPLVAVVVVFALGNILSAEGVGCFSRKE